MWPTLISKLDSPDIEYLEVSLYVPMMWFLDIGRAFITFTDFKGVA
jgi:hypothetical protein